MMDTWINEIGLLLINELMGLNYWIDHIEELLNWIALLVYLFSKHIHNALIHNTYNQYTVDIQSTYNIT